MRNITIYFSKRFLFFPLILFAGITGYVQVNNRILMVATDLFDLCLGNKALG